MATLQQIRNRAGILIALVIGIALLAFVMGDLLNTGGSVLRRKSMNVAEIANKPVTYQQFYNMFENHSEINRLMTGEATLDQEAVETIREQTWQQLVRDYVMNDEFDELGVAVSPDELFDMIQGNNPHPLVRNLFTNPETGQLNKSALFNFLRAINQERVDEDQKKFWLYWENQIAKERVQSKYYNLIKKGLYVTDLQARNEFAERNKKVDLSYVVKRFSSIPDSAVKITEKDINSYYKKHKKEYEQEATRDIEYVVFEVIPTPEDDSTAKKWIYDIQEEFYEVEEIAQYINYNSDVPYEDKNYTKEELPELVKGLFDEQEGAMYGPYFENESYKLTKLAEINYIPDSVHARHILIQPNQNMDINQASSMADSLKTLIENGADFSELAREYSSDGSAEDGGDLGWFEEGEMVKPFNDTCFYGNEGDLKIVNSQFGIHIVEILDQSQKVKKVQIGTLVRKVEPSQSTIQSYYTKASKFAGMNNTYEKFNQAVEEDPELNKLLASRLKDIDKSISGLNNSREIIRWAFNAEKHNVSQVFELDDKFVVATLAEVRKEGYAPVEQVKTDLVINVTKEKKAEKIKNELEGLIADGATLEALAQATENGIKVAEDISLASPVLRGAGFEPKVVAIATTMEENKISEPIIGSNGVYVITVNNINNVDLENRNFSAEKNRLRNSFSSRTNYEAYEALKEAADIEDNRARFF